MQLEWDEDKRRSNLEKHGLDFADANELDWDNADYVEDRRFSYPERRFWAFATQAGRLYVVTFCTRGERTRLISFRKANAREQNLYGKKT